MTTYDVSCMCIIYLELTVVSKCACKDQCHQELLFHLPITGSYLTCPSPPPNSCLLSRSCVKRKDIL
uniref:Secreted protein n=1 Tax=Steinernema glaseri TaxID=37863 RepID=A0A1I7YDA4_9BILA